MAEPIPTPIPEDVKARFWAKVDVRGPDECWPWLGSGDQKGYGKMWVAGALRRATHLALLIDRGLRVGGEVFACHHCDNPPCVNPAHLFAGTKSDNMRDCFDKGRGGTRLQNGWGWQKHKTHCKRGHPFSPENTLRHRNGGRQCAICTKAMNRRHSAERAKRIAAIARGEKE